MKHVLTGFALLLTSTMFAQKALVTKGQKFQVVTTTSSNMNIEVMGNTMENNSKSTSTSLHEVKNVTDAGLEVVSTLTNVKLEASAMGQEMSYDSDKKDNEGPIAEGMDNVVKKPKTITLDTKGNVVKEDKMEGEDQLGMSGVSLGKTSDVLSPALYGKELKSGTTWNDSTTTKTDRGSTTDVGTYTVTGVENDIATVEYTGTQKGSMTAEQMGQEITSTLANKITSTIKVNVKTGLIVEKSAVIDMNITAEAQGMSIPITGKVTSKSSVTEVK